MSMIDQGDHMRMQRIVEGLPSKSEKIRQLAAASFKTADIARFLRIRYQFVYNVLSAPRPNPRAAGEPGPRASNGGAPPKQEIGTGTPIRWIWTKVEKGGRIALPVAFRDNLGIDEGDDVQLHLDDGRIEILTRRAALRSLQDEVRRYIPKGHRLVDELIAERRAESNKEAEGG